MSDAGVAIFMVVSLAAVVAGAWPFCRAFSISCGATRTPTYSFKRIVTLILLCFLVGLTPSAIIAGQTKQQKHYEKALKKKLEKAKKICAKHPGWSPEVCLNLVNNELWVGMSKEMLRVVRGAPGNVTTTYLKDGHWWETHVYGCYENVILAAMYNNLCEYIFLEDGIVTVIQQQRSIF